MKTNKSLYPLRRVIGSTQHPMFKSVFLDLLECGHSLAQRHDIYGLTNPTRRRCRHCYTKSQKIEP